MVSKQILRIEIGNRIKFLRKKMGFSQINFARLINMKKQYLCNVEKGNSGLTIEKVVRICEKTGVTADYIIFGVDAYSAKIQNNCPNYTSEEVASAFEIVKNVMLSNENSIVE